MARLRFVDGLSCSTMAGRRGLAHVDVSKPRRATGTFASASVVAAAALCLLWLAQSRCWCSGPWLSAGRQDQRRSLVRRHAEAESEGESASESVSADDKTSLEVFRQSLIQGWGGGTVGDVATNDGEWAQVIDGKELKAGDVLLANPAHWVGESGPFDFFKSPAGPERVGMGGLIGVDWSVREKLRALPVLLLVDVLPDKGEAQGLLLSVRSGKLMGDFINHFHSRPLLYGGPAKVGVTMIHPYPQVPNATLLKEGLYIGGDFAGAQEWVEEGQGSSLRFRFFANMVQWPAGELAAEVGDDVAAPWIPIRCSAEVAMWETDSIEEKPLWLRVAELAGGKAEEAARKADLL